jgi:hypothetical protein
VKAFFFTFRVVGKGEGARVGRKRADTTCGRARSGHGQQGVD